MAHKLGVLKCDTGAQNPSYVAFAFFLFNYILHWIGFKIFFTDSQYLASN